MASKYYPVGIIALCILGVGAGIGLLLYFDLDERIIEVLQWLEAQGWQASLLFVLIIAVAIVLLLPGVVFTMGAGFVFGVIEGTLLVVAGTALGATLAFLIARYLLPERPSRWVMSHVRPAHLGEVIREEGWSMIMLTRLVPLFPFKLSNYFFGLTPVRLRDFALGNLIGIIPISLNNVYLGSIAADLTTLGQVESERTPLQWTLYGAGFVLAVIGVVGLTRIARRTLVRKIEKEDL
ncbi:TVP38/TMEM64 family protein [Microbulbifer halophilus]|uniref:TVP38/TMEM64 family membrane protein n=1 Tax=Microbulbifer halophilus TaxID=453963 RepID=A0ABW5ED84_9GAMM|nr:TVP38/TMEM64 family protein [Microbulbifer halophilus]MCW8128292.1 TVP38/TMEM64 family protein [Microbulbifer halophilus]